MPAKKRVLGSDLKKVDRHVIQPHEYDEIPELTDDFFERADHYRGGKLIQRGRPMIPNNLFRCGSMPKCCAGSSVPAPDISPASARFCGVTSIGSQPRAKRRRDDHAPFR